MSAGLAVPSRVRPITLGAPLMPATKKSQYRLGEATDRRIAELAAILGGPVRPLTDTDVVRECVRRVYESETKTKEKRR